MNYQEESAATGRQLMPDLVRAWALFGICVVNVGVISWPMMSGYHYPGGMESGADKAAWWAVNSLFLMKSYSLFSLMFGVGFAYQMQSAERRGVGFAGRYWRRIVGLLAFGIINITCLFFGDILVLYAVLGSLLFLFRKSGPKTLMGWGIGIYILQAVLTAAAAAFMWAGLTFAPEEMVEVIAEFDAGDAEALAAFGSGSFIEAATYRATTYMQDGILMFAFQGPGAFAFFLIGFALVKSGSIADPSAAIWKRSRRIFLPIGLLISAAGGWLLVGGDGMKDGSMMYGMVLITIGSPFSTFGYLGLIAKFAEGKGGPIRTFLARGGTASLTAYLMQNLILSLIFHAYGLDLFATLPAAQAIGVAAGVAIFTIAFVSVWRIFFRRGPTEYILRGWTYLGAR